MRAVTLYSSGVAYFEHNGTVDGRADAVLPFKTEQINDLLKSLVLQDLDGGLVRAVTYPSNEPIERQLGSFQLDLSGEPSLATLFGQLRGAEVMVRTELAKPYTATVLGVERRMVAAGPSRVPRWYLNIVLPTGGISSLAIDESLTVEPTDGRLRTELFLALEAVAGARDKSRKSVGFNFTGRGKRRVRLGYVVESPVWKTSYRLLLSPGDGSAASEPQNPAAAIQGWAIVENQTEHDWRGVRLSLVSGRPMSFSMDLYAPQYIRRPVVKPERYESLAPQEYEGGMGRPLATARRAGAGVVEEMAQMHAAMHSEVADAHLAYFRPLESRVSVKGVDEAADLGELFEYVVGEVDIARQSSAMIPIVSDPVEAERVSIYDHVVLAKHPLYGVIFRNTTGKHLMQGPVTVYESGAYAGDARLGDAPPDARRLVSYGIDLKVLASHEHRENAIVLEGARIAGKGLYLMKRWRTVHAYSFDNTSEKPRSVVVVHAPDRDFELVDTPDSYETTETSRRFRIEVPPGRRDILITAEKTAEWSHGLTDTNAETLRNYAGEKGMPTAVREALLEAAKMNDEVVTARRLMRQVQEQLKAVVTDQERLRENLKSTDTRSEYHKRLVEKLGEQETRIEHLQAEEQQHKAKLDERDEMLREYLRGLNIDP